MPSILKERMTGVKITAIKHLNRIRFQYGGLIRVVCG